MIRMPGCITIGKATYQYTFCHDGDLVQFMKVSAWSSILQ